MKKFILNNDPDRDGIVSIDGKNFRYLVRVRRLAVGEFFPALLPDGEETLVQIISVNNGILTGKCAGSPVGTASAFSSNCRQCEMPPVILLQALPKGDKMDLIVRQAAEGGITGIVPFVSEFSVAKVNPAGQKFSRWERIIKEARQQSGSKIATALHQPLTIKELIDYWKNFKDEGAIGLLFHHQGLEQNSLHGYLNKYPKTVILAVGPEGGFSDSEVSLFINNGFKPIIIGDNILRTETAALYCSAAIKIILLERDKWELNKKNSDNE